MQRIGWTGGVDIPPYCSQFGACIVEKVTIADFESTFRTIGRERHRYTVFSHFIFAAAAALRNAIPSLRCEKIEQEYLDMIKSYDKEDQQKFPQLLGMIVELLESEPRDILGQIFMSLGFSEDCKGQFFTPHDLSLMMARMHFENIKEQLKVKSFVSVSDPACGAGSMVMAFVNLFIEAKMNPAHRLFVQAVDIDRLAALMCYVQLSLWNVPAEVVVGNSLTLEVRERWFTPAYALNHWPSKLQLSSIMNNTTTLLQSSEPPTVEIEPESVHEEAPTSPVMASNQAPEQPSKNPSKSVKRDQLGFDF